MTKDHAERIRLSKFLSYVLRHHPEEPGLEMSPAGWVPVDKLIGADRKMGYDISVKDIKCVQSQGEKQRFELNESQALIRATYGHSVDVDPGHIPERPPCLLYHGTAQRSIPAIRIGGLISQNRQFVHLSPDTDSAVRIGRRHGKPTDLEIRAREMFADGGIFYRTGAGIWLTRSVPVLYIEFSEIRGETTG